MSARLRAACDDQMSAIADSRSSDPGHVNLRAYLAGGGASTALIAAAVLAFLTIAALVAFNGLPFAGDGDSGKARIAGSPGGAPEAAAAAAAAAPGAVAATPAAPTAVAPAPGGAGSASGGQGGASGPIATAPPAGGSPPGTAPGTSPAPSGAGSGGVVGGTVGGVEQTAGSIGLDVPLTDATQGVTGPVDQVVGGALNDVDGALGNPGLGDGANGVTDKLLP